MNIEIENPSITLMSKVGIYSESFPVKFGNYFDINGYRVANMWAENFEYLQKQKIDMSSLKAKQFGRVILIVDERIPKDFLNPKPFLNYVRISSEDTLLIYQEVFAEELKKYSCLCNTENDYVSVFFHYVNGPEKYRVGKCRICRSVVRAGGTSLL